MAKFPAFFFHWSRKIHAQSAAVPRPRTRRCQSGADRKQKAHTNEVMWERPTKELFTELWGSHGDGAAPWARREKQQ